jgi:hypothetical protein
MPLLTYALLLTRMYDAEACHRMAILDSYVASIPARSSYLHPAESAVKKE